MRPAAVPARLLERWEDGGGEGGVEGLLSCGCQSSRLLCADLTVRGLCAGHCNVRPPLHSMCPCPCCPACLPTPAPTLYSLRPLQEGRAAGQVWHPLWPKFRSLAVR